MWSGFISLIGLAGQKFTTAFLLSIAAIILSVWLYTEYLRHEPRIASDNAYNIVEKAVQGVSDPIDMVLIVQKWKNDGWTAQTGSLKTLCHYDRHRLGVFRHQAAGCISWSRIWEIQGIASTIASRPTLQCVVMQMDIQTGFMWAVQQCARVICPGAAYPSSIEFNSTTPVSQP